MCTHGGSIAEWWAWGMVTKGHNWPCGGSIAGWWAWGMVTKGHNWPCGGSIAGWWAKTGFGLRLPANAIIY